MATTDNGIQHDINHLAGFRNYLPIADIAATVSDTTRLSGPKATAVVQVVLDEFMKRGMIQGSTLHELALAHAGDNPRDSGEGRDFADGSDAKESTVCWHGSAKLAKSPEALAKYAAAPGHNVYCNTDVEGNETWMMAPTAYGATIGDIKNKYGGLRVQIFDPMHKVHYWFKIPYSAYAGLSSIEIPFNFDGTPKRSNRFWTYECESFVESASPF